MKIFALLIATIVNSALLFSQVAEFSFEDKNIRLPKTVEGLTVDFSFPFTNSGKEPIIIKEIKVECPCTKFEFPKAPIQPGKSDSIAVSFDTEGKIGYQDRTLDIYSNAKGSPHQIRFRIMVDNKEAE